MCIEPHDNQPQTKRARGSSSGLDETRRFDKLKDLPHEGSWRRCPECGPYGGRYVLSDTADEGNRKIQCWTADCRHNKGRKTWVTYTEMADEEAEYMLSVVLVSNAT